MLPCQPSAFSRKFELLLPTQLDYFFDVKKLTASDKNPRVHDGVAALPQTRWSVVARACDRDRETWPEALESILLIYRPVLVRHLVCNQHVPPDRAEDLVQMFLVDKLLTQNALRHASPDKGRLRSYMLKVFSNFVASHRRKQRALKRGPSSPDAERLDELPELGSGDAPMSEKHDVIWARMTLDLTFDFMRETCQAQNRGQLWEIFDARLLRPVLDGGAPISYDELVARFGLRSPSEASNLLITAKRMFARSLRKVIGLTVANEDEIDSELLELKRVLAK